MTIGTTHTDRSLGTARAVLQETCPICSGKALKTLHSFTAEQSAEHFLPRSRDEERHSRLTNKQDRATVAAVYVPDLSMRTMPLRLSSSLRGWRLRVL